MIEGQNLESEVRSYSRSFPTTFSEGRGARLTDIEGRTFIDFLSGCGSLNYGHNPPTLASALQNYITRGGLAMSMDMATSARQEFLQTFHSTILEPRGLNYRMQFPGPTGANAVEAAIKLARKVTRRTNIVGFTNAFHGCSLGALAITGNSHHRAASSSLLTGVTRMPYEGYYGPDVDTAAMLEKLLSDPSSGIDQPAAIILEMIQGEGGLNTASVEWIRRISNIAHKNDCLLIVDDIQAGCGRSGDFFSFGEAGITPDIVCLAKAISGFGLPMSLLLLKPEIDVWEPGEHNGTFRGNNHAFVTATAALNTYWSDPGFRSMLSDNCDLLNERMSALAAKFNIKMLGRGMMRGLVIKDAPMATRIRSTCFAKGLIVETCGGHDNILKFLPPLNVSHDVINEAFSVVEYALIESLS